MEVSEKEMAPAMRAHPGTWPTDGEGTANKASLARCAQHSPTDQGHVRSEERNCFYCLSGWVFLGSI
jgi:hypothetical protein